MEENGAKVYPMIWENNGLYTIQYPIYDEDVDEIINLSNEMLKMMKEMKKEESNQ